MTQFITVNCWLKPGLGFGYVSHYWIICCAYMRLKRGVMEPRLSILGKFISVLMIAIGVTRS